MYFNTLPTIEYGDLQNNNSQYKVVLTNILTRSAFLREIMENTAIFYDYQVKDGETPEIIADKLYGDVSRFWIVLLFNNLANPFYDFPLVQEQLNSLITSKYDMTLEDSMTTIHHYEERIVRTVLFNGVFQSSSSDVVHVSPLVQDSSTGLAVARIGLPSVDTCLSADSSTATFAGGITVVTDRTICAVSNYTYEYEENEKKRSIRLLDKDYVLRVEGEFKRLMEDNGN